MCNYTSMAKPEQISTLFGVAVLEYFPEPRYFVRPTNTHPVVLLRDDQVTLQSMRWGLIPPYAKDLKDVKNTFNARFDKLTTNGLWKPAFKTRRAIIPSSGGIDYTGSTSPKQPWVFRPSGVEVFGFAGLWSEWRSPEGERLRSFTIITGEPNSLFSKIHHRMAIPLSPEFYKAWLDPSTTVGEALDLLQIWPSEDLDIFPIKKKPQTDDPHAIDPIGPCLGLDDDPNELLESLPPA